MQSTLKWQKTNVYIFIYLQTLVVQTFRHSSKSLSQCYLYVLHYWHLVFKMCKHVNLNERRHKERSLKKHLEDEALCGILAVLKWKALWQLLFLIIFVHFFVWEFWVAQGSCVFYTYVGIKLLFRVYQCKSLGI